MLGGTVRVVDGDTLVVGGERVRLFGIDAVETDQTCRTEHGVVWACGAWVTATVGAAYDGRQARCEVLARDRHGRHVARCEIGGADVAMEIVRRGLAVAAVRYSQDYVDAEKEAWFADRGLHASSFANPASYRRLRGNLPPDPACPIKGNRSKAGRIYHEPGQVDYGRTVIHPGRGERWFCTRAEAEAAGWRRARR